MKKATPFLIGLVIVVLLVALILSGNNKKERRFDNRVTLRSIDKIPYGTSAAKSLLASLYPIATLYTDAKAPGQWDSVNLTESAQAVVLISDHLDADRSELEELSRFVNKGNFVFIISRSASYDLTSFFDVGYRSDYFYLNSDTTQLRISLQPPGYQSGAFYTYPGRKHAATFSEIDTPRTAVLGRDVSGNPNFIQLNQGNGRFFIHSAPTAFSNYFVLHQNNAAYFEGVMSVLPKNVKKIVWSEYYLNKPKDKEEKAPNWLAALFSQPAFKWSFLLAAATLLLSLLLGMRRRQRIIPVHEQPKNDSLDFVQTLGRLYYDKRDHRNLAQKMAAYFLEHIRSRYGLPTHTLDEAFINSLHQRSGYPAEKITAIVNGVHDVRLAETITDVELNTFYQQLEHFYQNT